MWNYKHNVFHHQYTNVAGVDEDLEAWPFLRLSPAQRRLWFHRFQWLYIWPLYVFFPPKWEWFDDFRTLIRGKVGAQKIVRPKGWNLTWLFAGKALFFTWALIIPLFVHSFWHVVGIYAFVALVLGITLGTVFQLAHCVEETEFHLIPARGARLPDSWAEHQLATTADFAPRNPLLTWYLGGLNYQVEHHLFPKVSHVHYRRLQPLIQKVCSEAGVKHLCARSFPKALISHVRYLHRMGKKKE
jgi:linoleoyl-CoA desaturase